MGFWQMIFGVNVFCVLVRLGVDWVMVDCEYGNIDGRRFILLQIYVNGVILRLICDILLDVVMYDVVLVIVVLGVFFIV